MDCEMPVMDGYEASRIIRESGSIIPILGFSGNSGEQFVRKCKLSGMSSLVGKPVDFEALQKAVKLSLEPFLAQI